MELMYDPGAGDALPIWYGFPFLLAGVVLTGFIPRILTWYVAHVQKRSSWDHRPWQILFTRCFGALWLGGFVFAFLMTACILLSGHGVIRPAPIHASEH